MQNNVKAAKVIIVVKVFRNTHMESQKAKNIVQQQPIIFFVHQMFMLRDVIWRSQGTTPLTPTIPFFGRTDDEFQRFFLTHKVPTQKCSPKAKGVFFFLVDGRVELSIKSPCLSPCL